MSKKKTTTLDDVIGFIRDADEDTAYGLNRLTSAVVERHKLTARIGMAVDSLLDESEEPF